jgi:hypothetical protein
MKINRDELQISPITGERGFPAGGFPDILEMREEVMKMESGKK